MSDMPKRNRSVPHDAELSSQEDDDVVVERSSPAVATPAGNDTAAPAVESPAVAPARDPMLERALSTLELDEEFKDSIRAMTPTTQREVLNDVIRGHHQQQLSMAFDQSGEAPFAGHLLPPGAMQLPMMQLGRSSFQLPNAVHEVDDGDDSYGLRSPLGAESAAEEAHEAAEDGGEEYEDDDEVHVVMLNGDGGPPRRGPESLLALAMLNGMEGQTAMSRLVRMLISQSGFPAHRHGGPAQDYRMALMQQISDSLDSMQQSAAMAAMGIHRDIDDMSYEELLELEERIGNVSKGLRPSQMESCMTALEAPPADGVCTVCLEELKSAPIDAEPVGSSSSSSGGSGSDTTCVRLNVCQHIFHKRCILQWFQSNKTCPVCKQEVVST